MLMMRRMPFALLRAPLAKLSAQPAHFRDVLASTHHDAYRHLAGLRAVAVKPDAAGHLLHVLLIKTGIGAHFAGYPALHAGLDTAVIPFLRVAQIPSGRDIASSLASRCSSTYVHEQVLTLEPEAVQG
jgi:hypothetical protein